MEYSSVISLGGYCQVTYHLKRCGISYSHSPFDWLVTPFESISDIIADDGQKFGLDITAVEEGRDGFCENYKVLHAHDFPHDSSGKVVITEQTKSIVREKFAHKCAIFYAALRRPGRKLLIRLGGRADPPIAWPYLTDSEVLRNSEIRNLCDVLDQRCDGDFDLLLITFKGRTTFLDDEELPLRVRLIQFDVPMNAQWMGSDADWDKCFDEAPHVLGRK